VDDVVLVAVVDALEDLLHKDGAITLGELASLEDLVEELTSLADPKK
jgi:hypothetical protein